MPRVSVVIPSFNHEAFIEEAISSVLAQTLSDLELVIVDDGSSDGSVERIRRLHDERIVTHFQENHGAHHALNKGFELASPGSEFVAILNSDDVHEPRWLETCARLMDSKPEVGFCAGLLEFPGDDDGDKRAWHELALAYYRKVDDVTRALTHRNFIMTTSNVFLRKRWLDVTGGFRPLRYVHDLDLFLRLAAVTGFELVEEPLVSYRIHAGNTITEAAKSCRIVYEFAWILVDRVFREYSASHRPEELFRRIADMVCALDLPEVACAALALFPLRADPALRRASDEETTRFALSLLDEDSPVFRQIASVHRTTFSESVDAMRHRIGHLEYDLREMGRLRREDIARLEARISELTASGRYRLGQAFDEARSLGGLARLPGRFVRIALDQRAAKPRPTPTVPPGRAGSSSTAT